MIQIQQIKLRPDHTREDLERKIRRELGLKDSQPLQYRSCVSPWMRINVRICFWCIPLSCHCQMRLLF